MMCVHVLDLDHDRIAAQLTLAWQVSPMARIMVGDDKHAIAKGETGTMPADPPELAEAEGVAKPLNCFLDIGVNQFRDDTGRPGRAADQHATLLSYIPIMPGCEQHCREPVCVSPGPARPTRWT